MHEPPETLHPFRAGSVIRLGKCDNGGETPDEKPSEKVN
jgi:hypothetical protein